MRLIIEGGDKKVKALARELRLRFRNDKLTHEVVESEKEPKEEKPKRKRRTKEEMQKEE